MYAYVRNNPATLNDPTGLLGADPVTEIHGYPEGRSCKKTYECPKQTDNPGPQVVPAQNTSLSSKGLDFIKRYEKLELKPYKDPAGYDTVGYGHKILPGEDFSKGITESKAVDLLMQDVQSAVNAVNAGLKGVKGSVNQNEFDALVSLAFNAGSGAVLGKNQMMQAISAGNVAEDNFTAYRWIHVDGKAVESQALLSRRKAEYRIYSEGKYSDE